MHDVIVIGAGMAGLACARQLKRLGLDVLVLEKSAGLGGRMATRRIQLPDQTSVIVDHGAQYITADTDSFHRLFKELLSLGILVEWTRSLYVLDPVGLHLDTVDQQSPCYVCPDGMTAMARYLADSLSIRTLTRITQVETEGDHWHLTSEPGETFESRGLVVATPAPQVLGLLSTVVTEETAVYAPLLSAEYLSCLAVMAVYDPATPLPEWKGIKCVEDPQLAWVALDSSKRSQPTHPVVMIHSTPEFSAELVDADPSQRELAGSELIAQASQRLGKWLQTPIQTQVQFWRYSLPTETVGLSSLATRISTESGSVPLVCAGDWCGGAKVEGAWVSGLDAAERLWAMLKA